MAQPVHHLQTIATALKPVAAARDLAKQESIRSRSTSSARERANLRNMLTAAMQQLIEDNEAASASAAADQLIERCGQNRLPNSVLVAAKQLARKDNLCPSRASLIAWHGKADKRGKDGLIDNYTGRKRTNYGWEARAIELYNSPNKPGYFTVALWLRTEGYDSATNSRVRYYLQSMPATLGKISPARIGAKQWHGKHTPYMIRDKSKLPVGFCYEGDGHTCDVYIAHPNTGNPWRAELTPWFDVRSGYIVGWLLTESESGVTTLMSLGRAVAEHNHVPAMIHVDPGSGYKAKMITDEVTGFLGKLDIYHSEALPGNWRGKGLSEGWFKHFEERCGKRFETFCGHCRTDETLSRLSDKIKRGDIVLPSIDEYRDAVGQYIDIYNNLPQPGLSNRSPADLWAELEHCETHMDPLDLVRQREQRVVRYMRVQVFGRTYEGSDRGLAMHEAQKVIVEFDLHDMSTVTVRDLDGRYLCDAPQVAKQPWLPNSRIQELKQKRLEGQVKRFENKAQEAAARARPLLDLHEQDNRVTKVERGLPAPESAKPLAIDRFKTDY